MSCVVAFGVLTSPVPPLPVNKEGEKESSSLDLLRLSEKNVKWTTIPIRLRRAW